MIDQGDHEMHYGNYILNILHDDSPLIVKDNPMSVSVDAERDVDGAGREWVECKVESEAAGRQNGFNDFSRQADFEGHDNAGLGSGSTLTEVL